MLSLQLEKREKKTKLAKGQMPAVFYGPKEESTSVSLDNGAFVKVWKEAGESTIIQLQGVGDDKDALIQDVDIHPVSGDVRHADFYVFERGKKVQVAVPISFVGESEAEKTLGGTLVKVMHELEIEALPSQLPSEIEADISIIENFETQLHVKDIQLPEGVTAMADGDDTVASVTEAKEEEVEEATEVDMDSIEVEGEKKEGDEAVGDAGGEAPKEGGAEDKG